MKWLVYQNSIASNFIVISLDLQKRVARVKRQYYWTAIKNTPFTLVITYPERYGVSRVEPRTEQDIHRTYITGKNIRSFFDGKRWKIHPDW